MKRHIGIILELAKVRIATLATISMITGYILASGAIAWTLIPLVAGVFLIAAGSATVNMIQDRDIDGLMRRTEGRPLPTERVTVSYTWRVAIAEILLGLWLILVASNVTAMLLGAFTIFWYNAVYTPAKRLTAFAAVPGGVVGAIPPVIGWVAAGGALWDPRIAAVAFFFFIWQVPHFWLLLMYSCGKDYERAGLPSLTRIMGLDQIARLTYTWIIATAVTCLAIPLFGDVSPGVSFGLLLAGVWLVWKSAGILRGATQPRYRLAFKQINLYICWVITLLAANGVIA